MGFGLCCCPVAPFRWHGPKPILPTAPKTPHNTDARNVTLPFYVSPLKSPEVISRSYAHDERNLGV